MKKNKIIRFNAQEAHKWSSSGEGLHNTVYACIFEACQENRCSTAFFDADQWDKTSKSKLLTELVDDGFKIEEQDEAILIIRW